MARVLFLQTTRCEADHDEHASEEARNDPDIAAGDRNYEETDGDQRTEDDQPGTSHDGSSVADQVRKLVVGRAPAVIPPSP